MDLPLGPEIGQCCGGWVELVLARMGAADRRAVVAEARRADRARPHVYILGAGHTGRALAAMLQALPVRPVLVDSRPGELAQAAAGIETRLSPLPEAEVAAAPPGSAFVVLTHDHGLDFLLTAAALARGDAAYVGMIGSATKRAKFRAWCRAFCGGQDTGGLTCPIGAQGSADKRPEVIAAFVAAEVMAVLTAGAGKQPGARGEARDRRDEQAPAPAG
jgi:xanthine dehydrogenase accessory factor